MKLTGIPTPGGMIQRLRAQFFGGAQQPLKPPSARMPDLEDWTMPHRSVDMRDWAVAYNAAKSTSNPDRNRLMDLYDSLLIDSHLAAAIESRVLRLCRSRFTLTDAKGDTRADLLPLLEQRWFEDFMWYAAEADFRGYTLIELGELAAPGKLLSVDRINPRNVIPQLGVVAKRQGDTNGYKYREAPLNQYIIEVGRPDDLGTLSQVGPVAITKKYAVGSWADYVNKFGIPPRWVTSNSKDRKRLVQLEKMMQGMVSAAYAVLEGDEKLEVMQTPGTDAYRVFDELISRMNSEISKRILGQDGTTDNKDASGTYGSLKVLQGVAEDRHQADKASIGYIVNNDLFPRLIQLGYPLQGIRFGWDSMRDLGPTELVDAVAKLGMVFDIDPMYVEERTGIRILGARRMPGELGGGDPTGKPPGNGKQGGGKPDPNEPDDEPDGATASWPQHKLTACTHCGGAKGITAVAAPKLAAQAIDQLLEDIHGGATWSQPYFDAVTKVYQEGLLSEWGKVLKKLTYDAPDHAAVTVMENNMARFGAAKTLAIATELNEHVRESKGFADFKRRVAESGKLEDYNRNWMATEYANAVNTGMQGSRWYQMQRSSDALPFGEYWTQQDDQVRDAHAALDGKVWPLSDTIWERIWPPNGWGCRCTVLPTQHGPEGAEATKQRQASMADLASRGELERMDKTGFGKNKAISGEVFKLNKAYQEQLGNTAGKPQTLGVRDSYGTDAASKTGEALRKTKLPAIVSNTPTKADAEAHFEKAKNTDGVMVMKDSAGRPIQLRRATLNKKLKKEPARAELVDQLAGVLAKPDEVWLDQQGDRLYLKFTSAGVLRVPVRVDMTNGLSVRSFYIDDWDGDTDKQRSGLLLKRYQ